MNPTANYRNQIESLAAMYNRPELVREAMERGTSVRDFRDGLRRLERAQRRDQFGLHDGQLANYSIRRAVLVALGEVEGPSLEREVSDEIERQKPVNYKGHGGVFIPGGIGSRTALTSTTSGAASQLVFTAPGTLIEMLRARLVAAKLGATFLPGLTGPLGLPRQTASGTAYWTSENPTNDVTESNLTVDLVTLSPKTIQATQAVTRQLLGQDSVNADSMIQNDLVAIHGRKIDAAVFHGAGTNEPTGIYGASGVNTVAVGATSTAWYAKLADMAVECANDDADMDAMGYATTPGFAGKLMQTLDFATASTGRPIWTGTFADGRIGGYAAIASNSLSKTLGVSSNEHAAVHGNFADCLIGTWGGFEIIVDPYAKKKKGIVEITSFQMVDIQLRHGQSFCKASGITI